MKVPFLDLVRQYQGLKDEIDAAIGKVVRSGHFIMGPEVSRFEGEVARYLDVKHAISVSSGTDALTIALRSLGVKHGDFVVTTPFTFFATVESIYHAGAWPIFADIDPKTFNMHADELARIISKKKEIKERIKAILPVHLFGLPADMKPILEIGKRHGIPVVEDAAQALGATCDGKAAGTLGQIGCYSFFPTKNLGGYGDGGLVATNEDHLAEQIKMLRVHGSAVKNVHESIGYTARLDELQAAVLRVKLKKLDAWNKVRREHADAYNRAFGTLKVLHVPKGTKSAQHIYNQYTLRITGGRRDGLKAFLARNGVPSEIYYPIPAHLQRPVAPLGHRRGDFPNAEVCAAECLSLPVFPELTEAERGHVAHSVTQYFETSVAKAGTY